jgi:site-specific DNA-methyltransferase (adenine-specific)
MKEIPDGSVDMILCDLPYGTTACRWDSSLPLESLWQEYWRVLKPDGCVALTAVQPFTTDLVASCRGKFKYDLVWHKSKSGSAFTAKYRPVSKHESVLIFAKGRTTYNPQLEVGEPYSRVRKARSAVNNHALGLGLDDSVTVNTGFRYPGSVQFFQQRWRRQDQLHPTQKPVEMMEWLIKTYSNKGETVLDNCMGSGTTGVACVNTGRNFIGIEKDEAYFAIAKARIESAKEAAIA